MMSDAISTLYQACLAFRRAKSDSKEENAFLEFEDMARAVVLKNARTFTEGMVIITHVEHMADMTVWNHQKGITWLNFSINLKGQVAK